MLLQVGNKVVDYNFVEVEVGYDGQVVDYAVDYVVVVAYFVGREVLVARMWLIQKVKLAVVRLAKYFQKPERVKARNTYYCFDWIP